MPKNLKNLKITSTDLVDQGANPDAHIRLFKRNDTSDNDDEKPESLLKKGLSAIAGFFNKSGNGGAVEIMVKAAKSEDDPDDDDEDEDDESEAEKGKKECSGSGDEPPNTKKSTNQKEENSIMDKTKMTPEDLAVLKSLEDKYGETPPAAAPAEPPAPAADGGAGTGDGGEVAKGTEAQKASDVPAATQELHPEVKKALESNKALIAEVEELKKSLEIKGLVEVAKKYEIIGKKPDELAPKLYDLKKAGATAYDDFIAILDEHVVTVGKSGMFSEVGSSRSGSVGTSAELGAKAAEIRKSTDGMTSPEAVIKAYEDNPELAAQYEAEYERRT